MQPPTALAHPFDDGTAAMLYPSIEATAATLRRDARAWSRMFAPLVRDAESLLDDLLGPLHVPRHPLAFMRFALRAALPATALAKRDFAGDRARSLFAGLAAHSMLPLSAPATASFGLVLGLLGHAVGWPFARGGSQRIADALASHLVELGGQIETEHEVRSLEELDARVVMLDVAPRQLLALAGDLPALYRKRLACFRYGPGVFKVDWALDGPIPWRAAECAQAATVHLGASFDEIVASEREPARGRAPERPFVLLAQHTLFDDTRAPSGKHTAWAYCHVPNGSPEDMTQPIEAQVERFAPGFRELVLARATRTAAEMEHYNANYVGGDINGGSSDFRQLLTRPVARISPYTTPLEGVYLCSASTPPGGGVHGMCGHHAARAALKRL